MLLVKSTALALFVAAAVSACGGAGPTRSTTAPAAHPRGFGWLDPQPAPRAWSPARLPDSAALAYPRSWRRVRSDPDTVSAARTDPRSGLIADYLNVTPQQGGETLENWTSFRPAHNADEGDSRVRLLAAARGLRFRGGQGSCVIDRYATSVTTYQEIACLVRGARSTNVIVAAALARRWAMDAPALERAVSAFVA